MTLGKSYENRVRKLAAKHGCIVRKFRGFERHYPNDDGGYMLSDNDQHTLLGDAYDATLDQIEDFLRRYADQMKRALQTRRSLAR
jgi:hypothetical protein